MNHFDCRPFIMALTPLLAVAQLGVKEARAESTYIDSIAISSTTSRYLLRHGDARVDYLKTSDPTQVWQQTYVQSDEPASDYCGPTAGRNLLDWYGKNVSYNTLASQMHTNDWCNDLDLLGLCASACGALGIPDIFGACSVPCKVRLEDKLCRGSLPDDVRDALVANAPTNYTVSYLRSGSLEDILMPLSDGNPVVALWSEGEFNLHWVVVTGHYLNSSNELVLRIANGSDLTWADFKSRWSLSKVTDSNTARHVLEHFGIKPYVMLYYTKGAATWDETISGNSNCEAAWKTRHVFPTYAYSYYTSSTNSCGFQVTPGRATALSWLLSGPS